MRKKVIAAIIPIFLYACAGSVPSKMSDSPQDLMVTYFQSGLNGRVRMAVPLTPERLKKIGSTKMLRSSDVYDQLSKISSRNCTLQMDENLVALVEADNLEVYILFNKKIATHKGVCDIPFSEANELIQRLELKFTHHNNGYDVF